MKEVDYIVVGLGLAGIAFCEQLERAEKSFVVFESLGPGASRIAAGLYNPVILKRYTLPWKAIEQLDMALPYFEAIGAKIGVSVLEKMPVRKIFSSVEDQNNWFAASDKPGLSRFVSPSLVPNESQYIDAPVDFGEVQETGRIDIKKLQAGYQTYLEENAAFAKANFIHEKLVLVDDGVMYEEYQAKRIVFAEGYGIKDNPYFQKLPLVGNKGEYLILKAPDLQLTAAIKTSFFIVPLGEDVYKVGATFNWTDKDTLPSKAAKEELLEKFRALVSCEFEIIDQEVGIRPTTGDRRALIGVHPQHSQLALLNGLGTRGIMAGPMLAQCLFNYLEEGIPLPAEIDIQRFPKKF